MSGMRAISMRNNAAIAILLAAWAAAGVADAAPTFSADPKAKGKEITAASIRSDDGFGDTQAQMIMRLTSESGEVSQRSLQLSVLEGVGDQNGDKSLIVFQTPVDVQGTVLLTHTQVLNPDDQWIYIPSIARVKRISSTNKSGPFLGSEFAFEDLTAQVLGKYDYIWLRDEACPAPDAALRCYVVERTPLYENSGYKRQIAWIDATEFQFRKVEYYNREDRLLKTLSLTGYTKHNGKFWRAHKLVMVNHQTNRSTTIDLSSIRFGAGQTEADFGEQSMERLSKQNRQ